MGLREYKRKRHFDRTPEPSGQEGAKGGRSFVIQKHAASHLHYDFRLELDGVLKSWAVPKGPSLDPSIKRLAMHVEDHPVEYGSFEGIIPEGEYGGGTVMLWDHGEWEAVGDPHEGYRTGRLKFKLDGQKLRGSWMLIRTGGQTQSEKDQKRWLLFKERDDVAMPVAQGDVLDEMPLSVSTGRNLEEIAADRDWVWGEKATSNRVQKAAPGRSSKTGPIRRKKLATSKPPKTPSGKMPTRIDVELATLTKVPPDGDQWLHEIKFDGYRMICRIDDGRAEFFTRNQQNWTKRITSLVEAVKKLPVTQAILDGEIVALRPDGVSDFQELQNAFRDGRTGTLRYYIFDLLYLDGHDLTQKPLEERKQALAEILGAKGISHHLQISEHIGGDGPSLLQEARKKGLEGIISKRRDRPYTAGRGYDWLKVKCLQNDEFVIGGFTDPAGSRTGFGALLLGYHKQNGPLIYAGKVGTGFDDGLLRRLGKQLRGLEQGKSPFSDHKRGPRGTHWVSPTLVAQIVYGSRTHEGILRHASFQGLREDKPARDVTRDQPIPLSRVVGKGKMTGKHSPEPSATRRKSTRRASTAALIPTSEGQEYDAGKQEFAGVRLTSPDKVLYPEEHITKLELANYYRAVSVWMLPHITNRPLVLFRCPEGRAKECFFQKHPGVGSPENLRTIPIREKARTEKYVVVDNVEGLISLAQVGALEIHAWGSRADKLEQPDRLIFDLDPDPDLPWKTVVATGRQVREFLQELGLESFVKTTGGKGLHIVVPIERRLHWEEAKAFCKEVADLIVMANPDQFTATMAKAARTGKIFIDYLRNGRGATAIVPYSTRARPGAPVSVPLAWEELSARIAPNHFSIRTIGKRLASLKSDPWEGINEIRQGMTGPLKKIRALSPSCIFRQ